MRAVLFAVALVAVLVSAMATPGSVAKLGADARYTGFDGTMGALVANWTLLLGDAAHHRWIGARVENGVVTELSMQVSASTTVRVVPIGDHVRLYTGAEKMDRRRDGKTRGFMTEFGVIMIGTTWARVQTLELDMKVSRTGGGLAARVVALRELVPPATGAFARVPKSSSPCHWTVSQSPDGSDIP
jgi:hypothetical protein